MAGGDARASLQVRARARALMWLARREHSRQELARRLARWLAAELDPHAGGVDGPLDEAAAGLPGLIEPLLDELQAAGHLSDARFAESRIHARQSRFGIRRIRHELREHGLALDDGQRQALLETELQRARRALASRFPLPAGGDGAGSTAPGTEEDPAEHPAGHPPEEDAEHPAEHPAEHEARHHAGRRTVPAEGPDRLRASAQAALRREQARRQRFLLARGFTPETIRAVLRDAPDDED